LTICATLGTPELLIANRYQKPRELWLVRKLLGSEDLRMKHTWQEYAGITWQLKSVRGAFLRSRRKGYTALISVDNVSDGRKADEGECRIVGVGSKSYGHTATDGNVLRAAGLDGGSRSLSTREIWWSEDLAVEAAWGRIRGVIVAFDMVLTG
jgi:hypothetical protein